ncbi:hypothetical protein [Streptomyces sp. NPDC002580]|uniref:hypothetical protein n=1 Tax=Streptomyces sp. NPDC002580 TaxID=3364653 RepID=UPI00367EBF56
MKPTTRGSLAAALTGVAAAVGAAAATPAVAVPIPVPLNGAEQALGLKTPRIAGELPVPLPGGIDGPRYVEGRMIPDRTVPQVPLSGGLPGADVHAPLPRVLGHGFEHVGLDAPAAALRTLTPGLSLDTPRGGPTSAKRGPAEPRLPQAALLAPLLRTTPAANLELGPGA